MAPSFIPIEHYRTKFYQKETSSRGFTELSEEQLLALAKKIYIIQDEEVKELLPKSEKTAKFEKYQRVLQHLTNPYIHLEFKTFDERVAYLIMMTDPNLVTFKEFLKLDLISLAEISKASSDKERERLKTKRKQTLAAFESAVREQIGFCDIKLLKFEKLFFKRYFNEKELITEVGGNYQDAIISNAKFLRNFNSISDERYETLVSIAQTWLSLAPNEYNSKVAAYSLTEQKELLGLKGLAEQLALFILLIDGDLDMLRIYEEESTMPNVIKRITEQFG